MNEEEDDPPVEHPLYWVNVLRGRVEAGQLHRLHRLLLHSSEYEEWIAEFIKARGLAGLFDVHENLFWRLYYNDSKGRGKRMEERTTDDAETFLACTNCFLPIFSSQAGINAVAKGNRSEVQEQVEQLMLSLASKEQEAREKALWAVIKIVGTITPTDQRSRARLTEMAHTLWDGLGSLQILLEEKNIYAPLVNLVREARGSRALALVGHVLALITLALDGLYPEIVSYEHIYSRNKLRNGFFSAGLTLAMEKQALQSQASADSDALAIYTAALKKWNYGKARDEKYSAALNRQKPKSAISSGDLNTEVPNLDAYSYCESALEPATKNRKAVLPCSPAEPQPKQPPLISSSRPKSAVVAKPRSPPAADRPPPKKAPALASGHDGVITIEERKKRRGMLDEDDDDDELNNYKVDFSLGDTNYVMCADSFLEAETDRLHAQSEPQPAWGITAQQQTKKIASSPASREEQDAYTLVMADDGHDDEEAEAGEEDDEEDEKDESITDRDEGEVVESYLSASSVGGATMKTATTWKDGRESSAPADRRSRATLRSFTLGEYREGRQATFPGSAPGRVSTAERTQPPAWERVAGSRPAGGTRRRRGAMSFVGLRQLQQREEADEHQINQGSTGLKSERSSTIGRAVDDEDSSCPIADPYLDFLVTVTTARLANSGSASPSSPTTTPWSKSSSPSPAHMLSASMPASALQGPLYSVMRRQQLEVQQTRKRLDAEGHTPSSTSSSSPSSTAHVFRTGNMQSTPQDLRSLASIVKRGILCAWSVQPGKDSKTGLPVPVSVFDPVRIIIDETNLYIAPQTTTEAELPTRIALSSIHRVREFRTASKDWVNKYGLTLEFMTNTTSRSEKVTLVAPTKKSQQWWMKAVIMNKGLLRDWNEEFQEAMTAYRRENINQQANAMMGGLKGKGRHKDDHDYLAMSIDGISLASLPLSVRASLQVVDLVKEFTEIAEVIAQIIVDELHCPVAEKLIPPTQLGGMAGGEKYLSHGILFKFAIDSRGLYNGDEFAMKATQHEIKGLTAYINYSLNSNFPNTLHFPVMSVIDYKGFRLSATSILPVGPNTIVYGSADGSKTVHNKYKDMNALMKKAGRALNLKPHWVTPLLPGPKVLICGPGDIEGHLGTDGRFYVLDTARVFPPTTPTPELKGSFLYRLMRPEFVKVNEFPLCSDAYSRWAHDPDNPNVLKQHNAEIVEATNHLVRTVIPAFVQRLQAFFETIFIESLNAWQSFVEDMRVLVIDMHRGGINCRYLGVIRQHVTNTNLRKSMLIEMVSRVLKNELREHMRNVRSSSEEDNKDVIATFFGRFLQDPHFWQSSPSTTFDVKQRLQERFPSCLTVGEQMPGWDLRAELHIGAVFARVNQLMGLNWSQEFDTRLWRWLDKPLGDLASIEELRCSIVKISPTVAQLPLVSFFAAKKFEKYADSPYASTKKQLESFLLKARDQYLLALEMKSDDVTILLNLASLFARLARCIEEQMHDPRTMAKMRKVEGFDMKHFRHRAHRFYQSADRQYQEALRIDSTRADLLAGYAAYLLTLPERAKEAEKYYTLAMQANPHNDELKAKHERFHDDLHHRHHPAPPLDLAASSGSSSSSSGLLPKSGALLGTKTLRLRRLQSNSLKGSGILRLSSRREADDIVISSPQTMKRTLQIALVAGRSLHGRGGKESDVVDPYCVLQLGQQVQRSTTKRKTSSPSWNETFSFTITNAQEAVKLYVYDTGLFSLTQNCMGMRVLPISEIEAMNGHTGWYVLCASEGEPSDLALGEVRLHFQLE